MKTIFYKSLRALFTICSLLEQIVWSFFACIDASAKKMTINYGRETSFRFNFTSFKMDTISIIAMCNACARE